MLAVATMSRPSNDTGLATASRMRRAPCSPSGRPATASGRTAESAPPTRAPTAPGPDALPAPEALEDAAKLFDAIWSEQADRLPDRLLGGVPVQTRRGGVPAGDDPVHRLSDDGVVGGLHHRLELGQGMLLELALRDVAR